MRRVRASYNIERGCAYRSARLSNLEHPEENEINCKGEGKTRLSKMDQASRGKDKQSRVGTHEAVG